MLFGFAILFTVLIVMAALAYGILSYIWLMKSEEIIYGDDQNNSDHESLQRHARKLKPKLNRKRRMSKIARKITLRHIRGYPKRTTVA